LIHHTIHSEFFCHINQLTFTVIIRSEDWTGGPALNRGLVASIEDELGKKLIVPKSPQLTTALGASVLAYEAYLDEMEFA